MINDNRMNWIQLAQEKILAMKPKKWAVTHAYMTALETQGLKGRRSCYTGEEITCFARIRR
jgi:hypothetical protein